jgi:hypothetical protein
MARHKTHLMAGRRTTLILDEESGTAARQLADHCGCPVAGVPKRIRQQRVRTLKRLFEIFEGNDAAEEVRRLKMED